MQRTASSKRSHPSTNCPVALGTVSDAHETESNERTEAVVLGGAGGCLACLNSHTHNRLSQLDTHYQRHRARRICSGSSTHSTQLTLPHHYHHTPHTYSAQHSTAQHTRHATHQLLQPRIDDSTSTTTLPPSHFISPRTLSRDAQQTVDTRRVVRAVSNTRRRWPSCGPKSTPAASLSSTAALCRRSTHVFSATDVRI